ncbi:uncharacterized protein B0I36DRAFT_322855 [Microdochium trichocladiopsis]|uniref:Uncharacterized protein n=1 Tax=Microdochium trichocladiopsis TaxID=1682393 RepID=A0A9P8Y696_9PEZI|nr:uncharacterized protein B0I36DRAFT_322855 [Microdochium trichocladiopsis]KAH7030940.1 hypothetical protein B0I36DRAFT_322855 [Microdochium trichocladiopsis]
MFLTSHRLPITLAAYLFPREAQVARPNAPRQCLLLALVKRERDLLDHLLYPSQHIDCANLGFDTTNHRCFFSDY